MLGRSGSTRPASTANRSVLSVFICGSCLPAAARTGSVARRVGVTSIEGIGDAERDGPVDRPRGGRRGRLSPAARREGVRPGRRSTPRLRRQEGARRARTTACGSRSSRARPRPAGRRRSSSGSAATSRSPRPWSSASSPSPPRRTAPRSAWRSRPRTSTSPTPRSSASSSPTARTSTGPSRRPRNGPQTMQADDDAPADGFNPVRQPGPRSPPSRSGTPSRRGGETIRLELRRQGQSLRFQVFDDDGQGGPRHRPGRRSARPTSRG